MNLQDIGGLRGEEKWRPDRIGTPEAREIRRGRREGLSGKSWRGAEGDCPAHSGTGSLLSSQANPLPFKAPLPPAALVLGGIGRRPGRSGEAGGRDPPRPEEQERRGGRLPHPLKPRKPAGLPGEVPCPLRPGVGGTPGSLLFLEPKPHPPTVPRAFSSPVGPEHTPCPPPKPCPCLGPTLHSQGLSPLLFFFLFPPPLFYYCGTDVASGC